MDEYKYITEFYLINGDVLNIEDANDYLQEEDMTKFLKSDLPLIADGILHIQWEMTGSNKGVVVLTTSKKLTDKELSDISEWIKGQNSDGIGEGFEQQHFACYTEKEYDEYQGYCLNYDEDEENGGSIIQVSFDCETNDYELKLI